MIWAEFNWVPIIFSQLAWETYHFLDAHSGVVSTLSPLTTSTDSTVNAYLQYSEKPQTKVFKVTMAFGFDVAVISIKTFLVYSDILEYSELMIGGREQIYPVLSKINGKTGESFIKGRYSFNLWF